ncbi:MAG TPA: segregation/condensation protein A, partial [Acidobacteriota bacterium]|nr:segregation/condensation protein A [Acidobacteriota bacterium]
DIIKLAEVFTRYMAQLQKFDFRVPARFILVAAILLRMKAELLLDEEEQKALSQKEIIPLDIENVPMLLPPMTRKPTRKVTLSELVSALNKAFEFQERKEGKQLRMRRAVERLIEKEEDIEVRIDEIYREIVKLHSTTLSELVHSWRREDIVKTFLPVLHLMMRDLITVDQEEMFKEIFIKVREKAEIDGEKKT